MKNKENVKNLQYIKKFSKINISDICRRCKVDRSNLINGKTSEKNIELIKEMIENDIAKLYIKEE